MTEDVIPFAPVVTEVLVIGTIELDSVGGAVVLTSESAVEVGDAEVGVVR